MSSSTNNTPITAIRVLQANDKVKVFDCGTRSLNDFLRRHAFANAATGLGVCRVAVDSDDQILGYYVLSSAQVRPVDLPPDYPYGLPRYPTPCVRLSRLAVDKRHQGQGIGSILLVDASNQVVHAAQRVGMHAMVVDAIDERAAFYYRQFGFVPLRGEPRTLVVPLVRLRELFGLPPIL